MKGSYRRLHNDEHSLGNKESERGAEGQTLRSDSSLFSGIPTEQGAQPGPIKGSAQPN